VGTESKSKVGGHRQGDDSRKETLNPEGGGTCANGNIFFRDIAFVSWNPETNVPIKSNLRYVISISACINLDGSFGRMRRYFLSAKWPSCQPVSSKRSSALILLAYSVGAW
jgi:hypothetical protein